MEKIDFKSAGSRIFVSYGRKLLSEMSWYPQELCNDWPHLASALSLGESPVVRFGINYPLRTGLDPPIESQDYAEQIVCIPRSTTTTTSSKFKENGLPELIEEIFISRGVCIVSLGPVGGPSFLKGLYRPIVSYGTGNGITSFAKAKFPSTPSEKRCKTEDTDFLCLIERGGISMYSETSSETHVSHVPEFHIDHAVPCSFGLIVIPSRVKKDPEGDFSNGLYVLTHPIKQVSKIWLRNRPGHDYIEYDSTDETLLACEKDVCIFWNFKANKIILRRLLHLDKEEMLQLSVLNTSMYLSVADHSNRNLYATLGTPNAFSTFLKKDHGVTKSGSPMRVNKDGSTVTYWPSFDFSGACGNNTLGSNSFGVGFYPPHICIYDDPELYFKPLFQIDLPKGNWKIPAKFRVLILEDLQSQNLGLCFLIKTNLYIHGVNIDSGAKLTNYVIKNVIDFAIPDGKDRLPLCVILDTVGRIKLCWINNYFDVVLLSTFEMLDVFPSKSDWCFNSIENIFQYKIVVTLKQSMDSSLKQASEGNTSIETALIELRSHTKHYLIRRCIELFRKTISQNLIVKIIAKFSALGISNGFDRDWSEFLKIVQEVCDSELFEVQQETLFKVLNVLKSFKEEVKIYNFSKDYSRKLHDFFQQVLKEYQTKFPDGSVIQTCPNIFSAMCKLIEKRPTQIKRAELDFLPEVMQLLLDDSDALENLARLAQLKEEESSFSSIIELLIADFYHRNGDKANFKQPVPILKAIGRYDYLSGTDVKLEENCKQQEDYFIKDELSDEPSWTTPVLNLDVFSKDRRIEEVCRLLDSSSPITIDVEQRAEMSDHDFLEEQEKHLLQLVQVSYAAPVGRTAFTLRCEDKVYANLSSYVVVPTLALSGRCSIKGTTVELNETDLPSTYSSWPLFHNTVAAAVSVRFTDSPADAWFNYNNMKIFEGQEQGGMILGFGLNGILSAMPPTLRHEYLAKENSFTTMAMLLGLSANLAGSGDISVWKLISLHIGAMLPACTTELEIPRLASLVAPCALGLLFLGTHNSYIAKVLLGEISKKFTPLSIFGPGVSSNSVSVINPADVTGSVTDREAHSLCAGFGLGFVNLAKGKCTNYQAEDDIDGILRRFVVGGPKPSQPNADQEDMFREYGQTLPSLWEEYRCCHIEEGDNVNVDVTTPSAIIAVALIYLRSGSEAVLNWLAPPNTLHLLDGVRPDLLLLRSLASILVFEEIQDPSVQWLESALMPEVLIAHALTKPEETSKLDHENINQFWASIVCGYCIGLGVRFAGTGDINVKETLWHYAELVLKLNSAESSLMEYFPKNFLDSCICNILISLSLVMAGSGDITILRLCRYLQAKISSTPSTASNNTYGLQMCISMSTGILFLGGGRYSLSNDDKSIAVILASVFPKWPINANDNRYHLQSLRHLYILAAQPRLIIPKPLPLGLDSTVEFKIECTDGNNLIFPAPVLLPPFYLIKKISLDHGDFFPIEFNLPNDSVELKRIVENGGVLNLVRKPMGIADYGFLKEMSWREEHVYHELFSEDESTPANEISKIRHLNHLSSLADWSGIKQVVTPVLDLINGDPQDQDWLWQARLLHLWVERSKAKNLPTCFPDDLLLLLRKKAGNLFNY